MIQVNDRVKYSRDWLRSTGQFTGDIPFARGTVTAIKEYGGGLRLATVDWKNPDIPEKVHVKNLTKIGTVELV